MAFSLRTPYNADFADKKRIPHRFSLSSFLIREIRVIRGLFAGISLQGARLDRL
jgi:lipid-binding SYLF domain-containing protein